MPARKKTFLGGFNLWGGNEYPRREDFVADNEASADAMAIFDHMAEMPGVEHTATTSTISSGGVAYDKWTETLTKDGAVIARRESTENAKGWVVVVNITVPDRPAKTYTTTWTETNGTWKGVTA